MAARTSNSGTPATAHDSRAGAVLQVLVDSSRLTAPAEAELRAAVGSFSDTVSNILQRCVVDCADGTDTAPADNTSEHGAHFEKWLEHFGAFQVDHTLARPQHSDGSTPGPPATAASKIDGTTTAATTTDAEDSTVTDSRSIPRPVKSAPALESPPTKRAKTASLVSDISSFLEAQRACGTATLSSSPPEFGRDNDAKDRQAATQGSGKRRTRTSGARDGAGRSRYMGYDGYVPSAAAGASKGSTTTGSNPEGNTGEAKDTSNSEKSSTSLMAFIPGQLSQALREALGMVGEQDAPPYFESMRKLGWPPGWTSERYNQTLGVWETVPSIAKTSFPGLTLGPNVADTEAKNSV